MDWDNPEDVLNSLLLLYQFQTQDEKINDSTFHRNGVGFNSIDAPVLTSISKQLLKRGTITQSQYDLICALLPKYTNQIEQLEAVQGSNIRPKYSLGIYTPPKDDDGILSISGDSLYFLPHVYPSMQIKSLGFTWKGSKIGWVAPVRASIISGVLDMFPNTVQDKSVQDFLTEEEKPVALSSLIVNSSLFPHQKEATAFELKHKRCLIGMAPGTGKTASAIFAADELPYDRILVVCPLTLTLTWKDQIHQWIGKDATIWRGNISNWDDFDKWVITNYETVLFNTQDIVNQGFEVIIVDESILVKNRKAKRSQAIKEITKSCEYVWLLSGSPVAKFLDDMWMQLNIIDPARFRSYWKFVDKYCIQETNYWGTSVVGNRENAADEIKRDLSDVYFARTLDEVLDIPEWIFDSIKIPMGISQYKLYEQMENEFIADLPEGDQILSPNALSQMIRLIQFASNPVLIGGPDDGVKWKMVDEILEFEEKPAIIWTQFIHTAERLYKDLKAKYRTGLLIGEVSNDERQKVVNDFQEGNIDVLVAHPAVGKFGLTLTRARTAIYLERSFNGDDYYQSLYRIRRIGTTQPPHVIHMISVRPGSSTGNTIDQVIDRVLDYRKNQSLSITSGLIREYLGK